MMKWEKDDRQVRLWIPRDWRDIFLGDGIYSFAEGIRSLGEECASARLNTGTASPGIREMLSTP